MTTREIERILFAWLARYGWTHVSTEEPSGFLNRGPLRFSAHHSNGAVVSVDVERREIERVSAEQVAMLIATRLAVACRAIRALPP